MVRFEDAGAVIKFLSHGRVLAAALAYDAEHAEVKARLLLGQHEQFDSVIIAPYLDAPEEEAPRPGKQARKDAKKAYKEGLLH